MLVDQKISVVSGITMPYFPPRPQEGTKIKSKNDLKILDNKTFVIQGKLNGDRACVLVLNKQLYIQNRHGSWFKHRITNQKSLLCLPNCTLLDGEVWQKCFYPFEIIVNGGQNLMFSGPEIRIAITERLCFEFKIPYIFNPKDTKTLPQWEGYVLKKKGSFYLPLGSDSQTTNSWWKRKWCHH